MSQKGRSSLFFGLISLQKKKELGSSSAAEWMMDGAVTTRRLTKEPMKKGFFRYFFRVCSTGSSPGNGDFIGKDP